MIRSLSPSLLSFLPQSVEAASDCQAIFPPFLSKGETERTEGEEKLSGSLERSREKV